MDLKQAQDELNATCDRIAEINRKIIDDCRAIQHSLRHERYIPVTKLENSEDWIFTLLDSGRGVKRFAVF